MQSARTRFQVLEETLKDPMNPLSPGDESLCLLLQRGLTTERHLPRADGWGQGCQADGWMLLEPCKVSDICNVPLCDQRPCAARAVLLKDPAAATWDGCTAVIHREHIYKAWR